MPSFRSAAFAATVGLLLSALVALPIPSAEATFPGGNGLILFNRGGNLFTASPSGGTIKQITTSGGISGAKWSPDGKKIAYRRAGNIVVRTVASGRSVTVAVGADTAPVWAPTGQTIAFVAALPDAPCGEQAVFTVPASGGSAPRLGYDPGSDNCPHGTDVFSLGSYTPDGTAVLLTTCYGWRDSICRISQVPMDGASTRRDIASVLCTEESFLADPQRCSYELHLSDGRLGPGGNGILFTGRGGYDQGSWVPSAIGTLPGSTPTPSSSTPEMIYAIDRSGTGLHRVSAAAGGVNPTWSPRGDQVLFTQRSGTTNNVMRVIGTSATAKATLLIRNASQADWQPIV